MGAVTANGFAVLGGTIALKITGFWSAELDIDHEEALTGQVTISDGTTEFVGTVIRGEPYSGRLRIWMQGGAGKLGKELSAKAYKSTTVRFVLEDILGETGDALSGAADRTVLDRSLAFWHRGKGRAMTAIDALLQDEAGANWRILRDGSLWTGADQFADQQVEHEVVDRDEALGVLHVAPETMELDVGRAFLGRTVHEIVYTVRASKLRAEVWVRESPLATMVRELVRRELRDVFLTKLYASVVPSVTKTGPLAGLADVLPDNSEVTDPDANDHPMLPSGQTGVRVLAGLPGVRLELGKPERALTGFEGGKPTRPYVAGWQKGSTKARIGTLLIAQNAITFALLPPQFFPAGEIGNAAAVVEQGIIIGAGNTAFLVPIEFEIWETR